MSTAVSLRRSELLEGAIDLHVHAGPDVRPRSLSALALVKRAAQTGMSGIVLKSHHVTTSSLAKLLQEEVAPTLTVAGGVSLNYAVGGFNPEAVAASFALGGRFVWFSTLDATNDRRARGEPEGLCVIDEAGCVTPRRLTNSRPYRSVQRRTLHGSPCGY